MSNEHPFAKTVCQHPNHSRVSFVNSKLARTRTNLLLICQSIFFSVFRFAKRFTNIHTLQMAQVGEAHSIELIQTKIHSIWIISAVYYNLSVSLLCVCVRDGALWDCDSLSQMAMSSHKSWIRNPWPRGVCALSCTKRMLLHTHTQTNT